MNELQLLFYLLEEQPHVGLFARWATVSGSYPPEYLATTVKDSVDIDHKM